MSTEDRPASAPTMLAGYDRSSKAQITVARVVALATLASAALVLCLTTPVFFSSANLLNLGQTASVLGVVTVGQMFVMLGGGFDISVGATAGMTFFVLVSVSGGRNGSAAVAVLAAVGLALAVGAVNSVLVVLRRIPPFVATLGTSILIAGVVTGWSQGVVSGSVPTAIRAVSTTHWGPLSVALIILLLVTLCAGYALKRSVLGQHLYATGLNAQAAEYAGVHVGRVRAATYFISAILAALAGLLLAAYTGFADPTGGQTLNLESIAAAVIGGVGLFGGRGGAINAFAGSLLIMIVLNVGVLHGVAGNSQTILTGSILLAGAIFYGVRARR